MRPRVTRKTLCMNGIDTTEMEYTINGLLFKVQKFYVVYYPTDVDSSEYVFTHKDERNREFKFTLDRKEICAEEILRLAEEVRQARIYELKTKPSKFIYDDFKDAISDSIG